MTTIISTGTINEVPERADGSDLWLTPAHFAAVTGSTLKPEGFCRGAVCVPVPPGRERQFRHDNKINVAAFANLTERPWVGSESRDTWVLEEPAQARNETLQSLDAPDFELPDLTGRILRLSDHRGKKVLLASGASW